MEDEKVDRMRNNKIRTRFSLLTRVFISLVVILVVITFLTVLGSMVFLMVCYKSGHVENVNRYKRLKINTETMISSRDFLTLSRDLGKEGYEYFEDDKNMILISNLESQEYLCRATCYCETQLISTISVSKGIMFLVAALSSVVAYDISRKHFGKKCVLELEDSCPESSVRFELEDCDIKEIDIDKFDADFSDDYSRVGMEPKSYKCVGNCFAYQFYEQNNGEEYASEVQNLAAGYGCFRLSLEGEIHVDIPFDQNISREERVQYAKEAFSSEELHQFCTSMSLKTLEDPRGERDRVSMCAGHVRGGINPSVECTERDVPWLEWFQIN